MYCVYAYVWYIFWIEKKKRDKSIHAWISSTAHTLWKVIDRHEIRLHLFVSHSYTFSTSKSRMRMKYKRACSITWFQLKWPIGSMCTVQYSFSNFVWMRWLSKQTTKNWKHTHNSDKQLTSLLCFQFFPVGCFFVPWLRENVLAIFNCWWSNYFHLDDSPPNIYQDDDVFAWVQYFLFSVCRKFVFTIQHEFQWLIFYRAMPVHAALRCTVL